jgi:transposase
MPADFPGWGRVYAFFRRWREHGLITEFHDRLRGKVREREGRGAEPTAGIIDAQSVRAAATVPAASRGCDGGKKVPGRKRHIVTDTLGLLLVVCVTAANIGDRDAAAGRRPALKAPDASSRSHPRSARRRAFDRTPSTFADVAPRPGSTAISLARRGL